jgi:predicted transcriptional regulator
LTRVSVSVSETRSLCFGSHVLLFPLAARVNLPTATLSDLIGVRSAVDLALLDQSFLDERIEVWIEPSVVDFGLVVVFEFVLDSQPVWLVLSGSGIQQVALEASQIIQFPLLVILTGKYTDSRKDYSADSGTRVHQSHRLRVILRSLFGNKIYFMRNKITDTMIDRLEKEVDMLLRHLEVLGMVVDSEPIGIVKMSNETGYAHHKVRYSLRVLEEESLIEPTSQGAITTDQTSAFVDELDGRIDAVGNKLNEMKLDNTGEIPQ